MQIVDFSQVAISNFMVSIDKKKGQTVEVEESLIRHMILNSLRACNVNNKETYGQMVIACDGIRSWRKDVCPYYKANRSKERDESLVNWKELFGIIHKIRDELTEHFHYPVITVDNAEADDVIGTLCHEFGNTSEPILIVSGDKDFRQLQSYMNVRQYDTVHKKWIVENNPSRYLKEHIMRGDTGDGVCNFLSPADSLVMKVRQKPVMQKKLDVWLDQEPEEFCDEVMLKRYRVNEQLVDLSKIPDDIMKSIMDTYNSQQGKSKKGLFNYFIEHRLKNLMQDLNQF